MFESVLARRLNLWPAVNLETLLLKGSHGRRSYLLGYFDRMSQFRDLVASLSQDSAILFLPAHP